MQPEGTLFLPIETRQYHVGSETLPSSIKTGYIAVPAYKVAMGFEPTQTAVARSRTARQPQATEL
eukprot:1159024-Pelagomonas_calceolata.AAC.1